MMEATVQSEVLVIGGGFGGLWAAYSAAKEGSKVTLVEKRICGRSGHSAFAIGTMMIALPDDPLERWIEDIVQGNNQLIEREKVEAVFLGSYQRLIDLEQMGIRFRKEKDGRYARTTARGTNHVLNVWPENGSALEMLLALRKKAISLGVTIIDQVFIVGLLRDNSGKAAGAVGISCLNGSPLRFNARAVVVATNTGGFRGHHLASELQGTGTYMGYEIGAVIKNPEFHYINVRPALHEIEGSGLFPNLGGRWINGKGEYFMSRYVPDLQDRAPTQALIIAMSLEARQGNLPISCDVENMSEEQRSQFSKLMVSHGWMPLLYEKMKSKGVDLLRQNYEWKPAYEGNKMGLDADINCATAVPGLYAAGMARTLGINSFTGWSIASSTWSGYTAGRKSALYSQAEAPREPISTEEKLVLQEFAKPARNVEGIDPDDLILELQKVLFPYDVLILISEPSLHRALNQVHEIKAKLDRISCSDVHNLIKAYELKTMVFAAELSLKASLMRKETRPSLFYREDYPAQDDRNWLKWILVSKGKQGEPVFSTRIVNGRGLEGLE